MVNFDAPIVKCRGCKRDVLGCSCGPGRMGEVQHADYWESRYRFYARRCVGRLEWDDAELDADTEAHIERIRPWLPEAPASVFEYGCGWGRLLVPLRSMGYHVEGLDLSRAAVDLAGKEGVSVWLPGDPLPSGFDVGMTSVCLQHIPGEDVPAAVEVLRSVVRPGGRLILWENTSEKEARHSFIGFRSGDWYRALLPDCGVIHCEDVETVKDETHTLLVLGVPS